MGLMIALIVYFFILSFVYTRNNSTSLLILSALPIIILSSLRSEFVGNDTVEYVRVFKLINSGFDVSMFEGRYEIGFLSLVKMSTIISNNYSMLLTISTFIVFFGVLFFIKQYSYMPGFSLALFFYLRYYDDSLNTLRLSLAISLTMIAMHFLINKKVFRFYIMIIIAFFFHKTALAFMFIPLFNKIKLNFKSISILTTITVMTTLFFEKIFNLLIVIFPTYSYYIGTDYLNTSNNLATILMIFINLIMIFFIYYIDQSEKNNISNDNIENLLYKSLVLGTLFLVISLKFSLLARIADYYLVYIIILLPNTIKKIKNKTILVFVLLIILFFFICYYVFIVMFKPEWNQVYPYSFSVL